MIRVLLAILCLLIAAPAWAQSGLGLSGASSGLACQYNATLPVLGSGTGRIAQCSTNGILLSAATIGGSPISSTNGLYDNLLQGNAVLSATNGIYSNLLQGNAVLSTGNPLFAQLTAGAAAIGTVNPTTAANWAVSTANGTLPSIKYGGAQARSSEISAATSGNLTGIVADVVGRQIVFPFANKENLIQGTVSLSGSSSTSLISAPGASTYIYVTDISCSQTGSTASNVVFQNGSGGTTIYQMYVPGTAGAGFTKAFTTPIGGVNNMSANTALFFQGASGIECSANGFKGS